MDALILLAFQILIICSAIILLFITLIIAYAIIAYIIKSLHIMTKGIGFFSGLVHFFSGEFVFKWMRNGGSSVVFRALFSGTFISIIVIIAHYIIHKHFECPFEVIKGNGWQFCGIYAAAYAAFYARFVSQWTYLSNLYNQIKNAELTANSPAEKEILYGWMSGFIEDAESLHLETKPIFSTVILIWLEKYPEVRENYCKFNPQTILNGENGQDKINKLKTRISQRS